METLTSNVEAKIRKAFDFKIMKHRLVGPDNIATPFYGLFRSDNWETVGRASVSDRYYPHQTDDVVALVEAASVAFGQRVDVTCRFDHGHYLSVRPTDGHCKKVFGTKDDIYPRITIRAGYDGKAYRSDFGLFRALCSNLEMWDQIEGTSIRITHTKSLRPKMDSLIGQFQTLAKSWGAITAKIDAMAGTDLNMTDYLEAIYGPAPTESGRTRTNHRRRHHSIMRRLETEAAAVDQPLRVLDRTNVRTNAWLAFNAVQGYTQHDTRRNGRPDAFDRAIMANAAPTVQTAQRLALEAITN